MDKKFNHIIKTAQKVMLTQAEKQDIWSAVDARVRESRATRPAVVRAPARPHHPIFSPYFIHTQRFAVLGLAVLFVLGGGTSIAAQDALPNDALYAIKVNVNEEVRSWFSFGAESRAYFETARAGERLEEAKTLAVLGELDAVSQEKIKKNFEKHAHKVQEQIATIEANNDLKVAINVSENFEQSLKEHSKSLAKIAQDQEGEKEPVVVAVVEPEVSSNTEAGTEAVSVAAKVAVVEPEVAPMAAKMAAVAEDVSTEPQNELVSLVTTVEENIIASAVAREEVEAKISTLADNQTRKEVALDKQKDAVGQIEKVKNMLATSTAPVTVIAEASTTVVTAQRSVDAGEVQLNAAQYGDAFLLFKTGFETAVLAEDILTASTTRIVRPVSPSIKADTSVKVR